MDFAQDPSQPNRLRKQIHAKFKDEGQLNEICLRGVACLGSGLSVLLGNIPDRSSQAIEILFHREARDQTTAKLI